MLVINSAATLASANTDAISNKMQRKNRNSTKELCIFAIVHSVRRTLPYGIWTCKDGRKVVFNREYQPIIQLVNGVKTYTDKNEWINDVVSTQYLYDDVTSPIRILLKHLNKDCLDRKESNDCKKALLVCLDVLREYGPEEHSSVSSVYSLLN